MLQKCNIIMMDQAHSHYTFTFAYLTLCSQLGRYDSGCHYWCSRSLTWLPTLHHPWHPGMSSLCGPSSKENRQGTTLQEHSHHHWRYTGQHTAAGAAASVIPTSRAISTVHQIGGKGRPHRSVASTVNTFLSQHS